MFLTTEDYKTVVDEATLAVINQDSADNLARAESYAIDEVSSYLRSRYDMAAAYADTGDKRSKQLVMITCDVALYHLVSWLPRRIGYEIRKERYDAAIEWLVRVQQGKASPDLPPLLDDSGNDVGNPIKYGSWEKNNYEW
jgi:phage gp36-like protein